MTPSSDSVEDGLRLMRVFSQIDDPSLRKKIIEFAELCLAGGPPADPCTKPPSIFPRGGQQSS